MKKALLLLFALFGSISYSFAQSAKIGIIGGLNLSTVSNTINGSTTTTSTLAGFNAGLFADIGFGPISIQPSILYSTMGGKDNESRTTSQTYTYVSSDKITLNYIQLPINILFHIPVVIGNVFVGGGPYVGYGISGKSTYSSTAIPVQQSGVTSISSGSSDVAFGNSPNEFKNPDFGAQVVGGIIIKGGLLVSAGYSFGIANLNNLNGFKTRNNGFKLSLGYSFL